MITRTYTIHHWQRCPDTSNRALGKLYQHRGVYRDGIGRLRCTRCMCYIHWRKGDEHALHPPTIERTRAV